MKYYNEFTEHLGDKLDSIITLASGMIDSYISNDYYKQYPYELDYLFNIMSPINEPTRLLFREMQAFMEMHNDKYIVFSDDICSMCITNDDNLREFQVKILKCATKISNLHKLRTQEINLV